MQEPHSDSGEVLDLVDDHTDVRPLTGMLLHRSQGVDQQVVEVPDAVRTKQLVVTLVEVPHRLPMLALQAGTSPYTQKAGVVVEGRDAAAFEDIVDLLLPIALLAGEP